MKKILSIMGVALVFTGLLTASLETSKKIEKDVTFKTIEGETLSLSALAGHPAIVTFWDTDCPSCIEEIPDLISLHEQYTQKGIQIISVTMEYTPPSQVIAMAKNRQIPYKIVLDPEAEIANAFGKIRLTPTTFLLDKEGKILKHVIGKFDFEDMRQRLDALV